MTRQITLAPGMVDAVRYEQYVAQSRQRLFRFAVVLCADPVLAEDILTDVLGRAYERWSQVGAADNVHAYVRRMVVNEYVSWQRRRARAAPYADLSDLVGSVPDHGNAHAERAALVKDLGRLPRQQRAAIVLRFYEALSDEEIAAVLGCRVGTVRSNISRGLATLRVTMATQPVGEN